MPASPRVRSRYATSTPRAVQEATADDIPYSTSSGCATTHSTRRKASSGNGGTKSVAMPESVVAARQIRDQPLRANSSCSAGFRRVVDDAFPEIGKVPRGGHEVAVVVKHDEVMMYCRGANQQVHG